MAQLDRLMAGLFISCVGGSGVAEEERKPFSAFTGPLSVSFICTGRIYRVPASSDLMAKQKRSKVAPCAHNNVVHALLSEHRLERSLVGT